MQPAVASWAPAEEPWVPATPRRSHAGGRAWSVYVVLAALLVPVLQPSGFAQATLLDALNLLALGVFLLRVLVGRGGLDLPLIGPVLLAAVGSLIAVTNANSHSKAMLTLVQDAYLYLWFVMLVNLMRSQGDQRTVRIAWLWAANVAAVIGLALLLTDGRTQFGHIFGARGNRAVGLFDGPNSYADYLMMSLFIGISLLGQMNRPVLWGSLALQFLALIASKSNGAMLSWMLGMGLFYVMVTISRRRSPAAVLAPLLVAGAIGMLGFWIQTEWGDGMSSLRNFQKRTFLGRFEQSAEGREQIWLRLLQTYPRQPLGIGPGNSSEQRVGIGQRERKFSYRSKEAHSDFLGYLVERGPLALVALVLLVALPFGAAWAGFRNGTDPAWRAGPGGIILGALCGGLLATTFHSLFMEKLHFRHYWIFLAVTYGFAAAPALERMRNWRARGRRRPGPTLPNGAVPR